jgi:DNA polymerase elongation subunit (family B)
MKRMTKEIIQRIEELYETQTWDKIAKTLKKEFKFDKSPETIRKTFRRKTGEGKERKAHGKKSPKILLFDIETLPLEAYVWSLWQDSVGLNMVKEDWSVLGWCAKWYGEEEVFYADVGGQRNLRDDKKILKQLHKLLDEADIVVGHNSDAFDVKKVNARFALHGMQPPSSYKRMDTKKLAKKHFKFTSNKLAYLTDNLCKRYKKLSHGKFPGFKMWEECLKRNKEAYKELKEYNIYDVLSLEELFSIMLPWESASLFDAYGHADDNQCTCGNKTFKKCGFQYTTTGKFQKHKCKNCGAEYKDSVNLLSKEEKPKRRRTTR